jgi:hypothetical protein
MTLVYLYGRNAGDLVKEDVMRLFEVSALLLASLTVAACGEAGIDHSPRGRHGRYAGIGIYPAGQAWALLAQPEARKDAAAALPDDDDQIIVAVDAVTGEIRQCGNMSGFCIGMNPWTGALPTAQAAPVRLTKHAAELDRSEGPRQEKALPEPVPKAAAPAR